MKRLTKTCVRNVCAFRRCGRFGARRNRQSAAPRRRRMANTQFELRRCRSCHPSGLMTSRQSAAMSVPLAVAGGPLRFKQIAVMHGPTTTWLRRPDFSIPTLARRTFMTGRSTRVEQVSLLELDAGRYPSSRSRARLMQQFEQGAYPDAFRRSANTMYQVRSSSRDWRLRDGLFGQVPVAIFSVYRVGLSPPYFFVH